MTTTQRPDTRSDSLAELCEHLAVTPRERIDPAVADAVLDLADADALAVLTYLTEALSPDPVTLRSAVDRWLEAATPANAAALNAASEPPRQAVLRALTLAVDGPFRLVRLRGRLLDLRQSHPQLSLVDDDFLHLFRSWFTPGFLQLREVSWESPGTLLQEIAAHESVHPVQGWADLRARLEPADRTCFALVHPAMGERPLVFVEVALDQHLQTDMEFLAGRPAPMRPATAATPPLAATFYSINTTYAGLRGVPLGHDLLKHAVEHLRATTPVRTFGTLSPVPGFRAWAEQRAEHLPGPADVVARATAGDATVREELESLARAYLAETVDGRPRDRVARFHLGNGARLTGVHWPAGRAPHLIEQSFGLMVTYLYDDPQEVS